MPGFLFEEECLDDLRELATKWDGVVTWSPGFAKDSSSEAVQKAAAHLTKGTYSYHRVGHDRRLMEFLPNGLMGRGHAGMEIYWDVVEAASGLSLSLFSESEVTCRLRLDGDGVWRGQWECFEQMPIEIAPADGNSTLQPFPYKLFTFADRGWATLKRRFMDTLKDPYLVTVFESEPPPGTPGGGGVETWNFKARKLVECVAGHQGEIILFTDIDLQFFAPTLPFVENAIAYREIAVQFERQVGINIGFLVIACSPRTLEFFQRVQDRVAATGEWDQAVVSEMLRAGQLNWTYLDRRIWAYHSDDPHPPRGIVVHHATGVHGSAAKLLQLDRVAGELARPTR